MGGDCYFSLNVPMDNIWDYKCFMFKTNILSNQYDNISCLGQEIYFQNDKYNEIMLLGSCEFGSFREDILLYQDDELKQKLQVCFTDWVLAPEFGEEILWQGKMLIKEGKGYGFSKVYSTHLLGQRYFIQGNHEINKIKLPECPNMHIFAISLR